MNKIDRVRSALAAQPIDHPPVSLWYHFGLQHLGGEAVAEAHIGFFRAYDLDWLKVMNDYPFPVESDTFEITRAEDWDRVAEIPLSAPSFAEQSRALRRIREVLGNEALFVDTVFSPWSIARKLARARIVKDMVDAPEAVHRALRAITQSLVRYVEASLDTGASGIFYTLAGASHTLVSEDLYRSFGLPYDRTVLAAAAHAPFNVLHLHGTDLMVEVARELNVACYNWSSAHTRPTPAEAEKIFSGGLIIGVDELGTNLKRPFEIRQEIQACAASVARPRLFVGPGCALPSSTPPAVLRAAVAAARLL